MFGHGVRRSGGKCSDLNRPTSRGLKFARTGLKICKKIKICSQISVGVVGHDASDVSELWQQNIEVPGAQSGIPLLGGPMSILASIGRRYATVIPQFPSFVWPC